MRSNASNSKLIQFTNQLINKMWQHGIKHFPVSFQFRLILICLLNINMAPHNIFHQINENEFQSSH